MNRCKRAKGNTCATYPGAVPATKAERKRLLNYGVSLVSGLSIPPRQGNTLMIKKNALDFQRKKGAGHREKRLKDML